MNLRGWMAGAVALLAAGCLTACSPDSAPVTPSTRSSASASPTPTDPSASTQGPASPAPSPASPIQAPPSPAAPSPAGFGSLAEAIAAHVGANDRELSGTCEDADLDRDLGKVCYKVVQERTAETVVIIGDTFSEFDTYLLVRRQVGGWLVVAAADVPYPDDDGTLPF